MYNYFIHSSEKILIHPSNMFSSDTKMDFNKGVKLVCWLQTSSFLFTLKLLLKSSSKTTFTSDKRIIHSHYKSNERLSKSIFDLIKFPHIDKLFVHGKSSMLTKDWDSQRFPHLINNIELCKTYTENFFI